MSSVIGFLTSPYVLAVLCPLLAAATACAVWGVTEIIAERRRR